MAKKQKSYSHILILLAGLLFIIKFLCDNGVPSPSGNVIQFIVGIFTLICLLGFYGYFVFGAKGCNTTTRALAPSILLFILYGKYQLNFGNPDVNQYLVSIANIAWTFIILCGFIFLFVKNKIVGLVFSISSLVYAGFVLLSYIVMFIIDLANGNSFHLANCFSVILLVSALVLLGTTTYRIAKRQSWN